MPPGGVPDTLDAGPMLTDSLIALKINQAAPDAVVLALRPVLDRALAVIAEVLQAIDSDAERAELTAQLDALRAALATPTKPEAIAPLARSCFDVCEHALHAIHAQQQERRSELRRLVTLVRDTVAQLAGDGTSMSSDISDAAGRFNALLRINDVQLLKQRLMVEVGGLQRLAAERRHQWAQTIEQFESRIAALEQQLVAVRQEASLDALTSIANRREFESTLRDAIQRGQRALIVAMLDLDDFKAVNDTGGHAAGDAVLQAVAQTLKSSVRKQDLVARIGGDEFALVGVGVTLQEVEPRIRTIVQTLASIPTGLAAPPHISVSCGLAEYCAGDTVESLTRRADQALYEAKHRGKNRVVAKSPPFIRDLLRKP